MDWVRGRTIGRGSAATVSLATCCSSGQAFAVKSAEVSQSESLRNEARILSALDCPHVVGYRGCDVTPEEAPDGPLLFNLLLEYAPGGSLSDVIRKQHRLEEAEIARYARQIAMGLDCLHSRGIVHGDLKPTNVLIGLGDRAKIADFGCAKMVEEASARISGTPMYMAPEVARGEEQGCPADIWALGCTVIEMATERFPWAGVSDPVSAIHKIIHSDESPDIPSHLSPQAKDFLHNCLKRDSRERWTAGRLLDHPFLDHRRDAKQVEEFHLSPTSVMDQEIWELVEASRESTSPSPRRAAGNHSRDDRIEKLTMGGGQPIPNWWTESDNEGWIDAREEDSTEHDDIVVGVGGERLLEGVGICRESSGSQSVNIESIRLISW
ncbi:hypothetical protein MLD38_025796 [Melastoma candidum]|uniref:Uncharacterized protein n=1 Tax=Melastoma candidum TaxID=119954 RepID=A0ACB9NWJ4_9MYRT|nr:hypothetical protein MLD38_025796 [Melastoma candidum]